MKIIKIDGGVWWYVKKITHLLIPVILLFILKHSILTALISFVYFLITMYVYIFIKKIDINNDGILVFGIFLNLFLIAFYVEGV